MENKHWERTYITSTVGTGYTNRNGSNYICRALTGTSDAIMERVSDGWTIEAHGIQRYQDGTIEWNYSSGGHWPKDEE